jgi:Cu+-exporting ATPase
VALGAAVFWMFRDASKALKAFASVLIVACPCAVALAAPLTHGTAQRLLARLKIFLKNALVIERMAEVDTIVLDKTGTLTTADARGVQFIGAGQISAAAAGWIGSLARHSTHPNSVRIAKSLSFTPAPVTGFREIPGGGIAGAVDGHEILLGSRAWVEAQVRSSGMGSQTAFVRSSAAAARLEATRCGSTANPLRAEAFCDSTGSVWAAVDGEICGAFSLQNALRPEVENLIAQLGGRFELALLSGDNEREAARFKTIFGDGAILKFNQSPADKLNFIRELQQRGRKVMMVGDGLNDAGALRQADVGVALVEQVGVFSPASDVILDAAELPKLARVLAFARSAARVVRAGFVISTAYNLVGVSIAAAGFLSPVVCAILMPISSATVVFFACGTTAWLGRRLQMDVSPGDSKVHATPQPAIGGLQLLPKEAA